jgi:SSS family solute:Na+ symporter
VLWQKGAFQLQNVAGTDKVDYNTMLPVLINYLVLVGLKGLLAACMAAALNSCATLISMDIVKRLRPVMVLAMLWSTQGDQFGTIFEAINKIPMTFAPAVTTVFVLGVLWKRGTKEAAMATFCFGSGIGVLYFLLDLPSIGRMILGGAAHAEFGGLVTDTTQGLGIPFMLVGPCIAAACVVIYVATSMVTPAMEPKEVAKVCWDHPLAFLKGRLTGASDPRIVALLLIAVVGVLYFLLR